MKAKEYFNKELKEVHLALQINNIRTDIMYHYIDQYADIKAKEAYESHVWAKRHVEKSADALDAYASRKGGFSTLAPKLKMLAKNMNNYEQWKQSQSNKEQ